MKLIQVIVAYCGQGGRDLDFVASVPRLRLADDCRPNDPADCHCQAGTVLRFSANPLSEQSHEFLNERDPLGKRGFLRIADLECESCPAAPAQPNGTVRRRFQFSVAGLMGAVGIFGAALWLLRAGLDAKTVEIVAASVIVLPLILAAAVDKLSGGRAGGISVAWAYCQLAAVAWLLAVLSIGMDAVSDSVLRPVAVMLVGG
jgi:hypothetical protein